jgi:hypothetical protein
MSLCILIGNYLREVSEMCFLGGEDLDFTFSLFLSLPIDAVRLVGESIEPLLPRGLDCPMDDLRLPPLSQQWCWHCRADGRRRGFLVKQVDTKS